MTDSPRNIHDFTDDLRRASKALADRVDAAAEEVTRARKRLGRQFRKVEAAMSDRRQEVEGPDEKVTAAIDELAAEAQRSFERIVTRKRPRRFFFF